MLECYVGREKKKFVRLEDLNSTVSMSNTDIRTKKCGFNIEGLLHAGRATESKSFKRGVEKGSLGLRSLGRSLKYGVSKAVFQEDLKVSEKKILDPQGKFLALWNKLFVISCILSVSVDPLFFYLPFISESNSCLSIDRTLAKITTSLRTMFDAFYVIHIVFQFRTAYIAPSSQVFGRGELVIDSAAIAKRYFRGNFIVDLISMLPAPQLAIWRYLIQGTGVLETKRAVLCIVLIQYIPRFFRIFSLSAELETNVGVFAESSFTGAACYLFLFLLASHIVGAFWYLLAVERNDACWKKACEDAAGICNTRFLYCGNHHNENFQEWRNITETILKHRCSTSDDNPSIVQLGIYKQALASGIVANNNFVYKFFYSLWWGLQNLSTLGQGLQTTIYFGEVLFSISVAISGLILFALLIGNMQTYLQSITLRLEEMRVKRRDSEQWMHHRSLPQDLRERVRRYDQYKWLETHGVDEENLVQSLPNDLRKDIKRHLCLELVRRVAIFEKMDDRLLDAICERLKPSLYTENTHIVREEDPVNEMLFIIRGRLESVTTDGGRSGFYNRSFLKQGDACGEELLTWALDPKSSSSLPSSTRTVKALTEVEAFALSSDELKFVASQFRRLHNKQVQHTFRFYSQHWRTWAASFIQAAWRRRCKRKMMEIHIREDEGLDEAAGNGGLNSSTLATTLYASRFAANALRGVYRHRIANSATKLVMQKPQEPDFTVEAD
ncbi:hypothetical protein IFM89_036010 [Coptis chinensis]|uniref:Cyclic nucleotide-binding domain-containing protein n=1 Tax=Coptis chinensis TaxID=261450 RepID=A0A835ISY2_9MAGN|nr:hypothetical protein IFM89_036010 [Coptis chinensis]